jgi:hypothetical protein
MKKNAIIFVLVFIALIFSNLTFGQKYLTFNCKTYSVYLKLSNDYKTVQEASYSENGKWVKYTITETKALDDVKLVGNKYSVKDAAGKTYLLEYVKDRDLITVLSFKDKIKQTLTRKK